MFDALALEATLPAADLDRAKAWYQDKLGLSPTDEGDEGGVYYETGGARFLLYASTFAGTNQATAASFEVPDFDGAVATLRGSGVVFEEYDFDDFQTVDGVLELPDGRRGAWFKDSEGNILNVVSK